jgi:hypothetical protein
MFQCTIPIHKRKKKDRQTQNEAIQIDIQTDKKNQSPCHRQANERDKTNANTSRGQNISGVKFKTIE